METKATKEKDKTKKRDRKDCTDQAMRQWRKDMYRCGKFNCF